MKVGHNAVSQLYRKDSEGEVKRLTLADKKNQYAEGGGASFSPIVKDHSKENCLVVSNDTDVLLYGTLTGLQRLRND